MGEGSWRRILEKDDGRGKKDDEKRKIEEGWWKRDDEKGKIEEGWWKRDEER
jgi:hypothetical protein